MNMATVLRVIARAGTVLGEAQNVDGVIELAKDAAPGHYRIEKISLDPATGDLRAWEWGEVIKDLNGGIQLDLPPWTD
jgi:hypothetical protein